jgi:hypothetical protein
MQAATATAVGAVPIRYISTKGLTHSGGSGYGRISRPRAPVYAIDRRRFGPQAVAGAHG